MKKSRVVVLVFVAILIGVAFWLYTCDKMEELTVPFEVSVLTPSGEEVVSCWKNEQDNYFVFLPAYSDLSDVQIWTKISREIYINGTKVQNGTYCDTFELNIPYQIVFQDWSKTIVREITFVKSENVATMFIDTNSKDKER